MSEVIRKAQRAICHYADDAEEAGLFLRMLGLHPDDPVDENRPVHTPQNLNRLSGSGRGGWE